MTIINAKHLILTGITCSILSCTTQAPPPVIPEDPVIFEAFLGPANTDYADIRQCEGPEWHYTHGKKRPKASQQNVTPEHDIPQTSFSPIESTISQIVPPKKIRSIPPEQLISHANTEARISPTGTGYFGGRAIYRYQYSPGKIYDIYVNPSTATRIYLPPGEKIATAPTLNPNQWEVGTASIGKDGTEVDVIVVRPLDTASTTDTAIDMESGRSYFLHLQPAKNAMLGVTWDLGLIQTLAAGSENEPLKVPRSQNTSLEEKVDSRPNSGCKNGMFMPVELAQLHTGYKIEVKGSASFVPTQIFDDARRTMIRLRPLSGNAPVVFTYKPDGSRGLAQFAPYYLPNDPARGFFLIVEGVWPVLELAGTDGQSIKIIRVVDEVKVAEPWKKP